MKHIEKMRHIKNFVIIGPGHWGGALAQCFKESGFFIYVLDERSSDNDWQQAFCEEAFVLIATPFRVIAQILDRLKSYPQVAFIINASKGIDRESLKTFSQLAQIQFKTNCATLSGPSFAKELKERKPTACVLAGKKTGVIKFLARRLSTNYFRLYTHNDPIGVEICGALKNVMAIACGISDGLGLGQNSRAALLSRGLMEIMRVVKKLKGNPMTVFGLAGVGDLWLTATGDLSRNRQFGLLMAKGMGSSAAFKQIGQPVEGLYTVEQIEKIRRRYKLNLPICEKVYQICLENKSPKTALESLMTRAVKAEESSEWRLQ